MIIKIMKKINIFVFTIIIFLLSSISAMEQAIEEFKQQLLVIRCLPKGVFTNIFDNNNDEAKSLCNYIKFFLALRSTNTYFNKFLTAKRIGQFCKPFDKKTKNKVLKAILDIDAYEKLRFPSLILIYAKANPNVNAIYYVLLERTLYKKDLLFTKILLQHKADPNKQKRRYGYPPLFYAKTKKAAQLLIKYGADINIKDKNEKTNILWYLIDVSPFYQKINDLFQFYIDKGVDPKALRPIDNSCLFHCLTECSYNYRMKLAKILVNIIPDMLNTINIKNQTPLDIAIKKKQFYENEGFLTTIYRTNYKELNKFITFLQKNGAKTVQQLEDIRYTHKN